LKSLILNYTYFYWIYQHKVRGYMIDLRTSFSNGLTTVESTSGIENIHFSNKGRSGPDGKSFSIACYSFSNFFSTPLNSLKENLNNFYHVWVCRDEVNLKVDNQGKIQTVAVKIAELTEQIKMGQKEVDKNFRFNPFYLFSKDKPKDVVDFLGEKVESSPGEYAFSKAKQFYCQVTRKELFSGIEKLKDSMVVESLGLQELLFGDQSRGKGVRKSYEVACYSFSDFSKKPLDYIKQSSWNFYHVWVCRDEVNLKIRDGEHVQTVAVKIDELLKNTGTFLKEESNYLLSKFFGNREDSNLTKARSLFKESGDLGYDKAMFQYALMCRDGKGGDVDLEEARVYFKKAADVNSGNIKSTYEYALMCRNGKGGDVDLEDAKSYFKKAADADPGSTSAMFDYALMCRDGEGGDVNLEEARAYLKKAADANGGVEAMFEYASMCRDGVGGDKSLKEAKSYFKKAADADPGHAGAMFEYASLSGESHSEEGLREARAYLKKAADVKDGSAEAMFEYASMCRHEIGGPKDLDNAGTYFKRAAALGHKEAKQTAKLYS
jgi:TPR repeat protein